MLVVGCIIVNLGTGTTGSYRYPVLIIHSGLSGGTSHIQMKLHSSSYLNVGGVIHVVMSIDSANSLAADPSHDNISPWFPLLILLSIFLISRVRTPPGQLSAYCNNEALLFRFGKGQYSHNYNESASYWLSYLCSTVNVLR